MAGDVPGSVAGRLETALGYWHQPGALEATCHLPIGQIPGLFAAHFNLVDIPPGKTGPSS